MHAHRQRLGAPRTEQRAQPQQRLEATLPSRADGGRQRRRIGRHVKRPAHGRQHHVARDRERLDLPGQRMCDLRRSRQTGQQRLPLAAQVWVVAPAAGLLCTGREQRVEGRLRVGRAAVGQRHVGRRHAVQHAAAHGLREGALVFERGARAVRRADQVDALGAELPAHGVQILHRQRGGVEAQVAVRQLLQPQPTLLQVLQLPRRIGLYRQRQMPRVVAHQRRRPAGAALIDEHDVAAVVQAAELAHRVGRQRHRALPRPTGQQEHRIGQLASRQRGHHHVVHVDRQTVGPRRIERPLHHAAQHAVAQAVDAAFLQRLVGTAGDSRARTRTRTRTRTRARTRISIRPRTRTCQHQRAQHAGGAAERPHAAHSPSRRLSSPLRTSLARLSAPPTNTPLTNTIGKVAQPVHIFNAPRACHWLK